MAFIGLEVVLFKSGLAEPIAKVMLSFSWFIVLALFMGVSYLANRWAHSSTSRPVQYLGLALYVVAQAIIFVPLLYVVMGFSGDGIFAVYKAGVLSLFLLTGITAVVFITRKDFSFLGPILAIGGMVALGFIAVSLIFGFNLGTIFSLVMVAFAATSILFATSNVLHEYRPTQHVAASLSLFAGVALLFWYILQIFGGSDD